VGANKKGAACSSSRLGVAKINASSNIEMLPTFSIARSLRKNTHAALYYSHADDAELEREREKRLGSTANQTSAGHTIASV
jgi:hypothetical protein